MMGLAVMLNNLFVILPLAIVFVMISLLFWFSVGVVLSLFFGPLGYFFALVMMLYYRRHF